MKVLLLTQYYLPENAPGAHRLSSLAKSLQKQGHQVEVLTSFPNYPNLELFKGYRLKWHSVENINDVKVNRCYTFIKKSRGLISRALGFVSFQTSSAIIGMTKIERPDVILCLSPPIFLGITGVLLKWWHKSTMVLNVADLWPESGIKLGVIKNKLLIDILEKLELFIYKNSDGIAGQTQGIVTHINRKVPATPIAWFKNGVDFSVFNAFQQTDESNKELVDNSKFVVGYTGLVGYAQGLEVLVEAAKVLQESKNIEFLVVGDGPKLEEVKQLAEKYKLDNIKFTGNVPKTEMPSYLSKMDVTVVPLKKNDLFLGAIPSKIFDSYANNVPVILGVDGEAKQLFCDTYDCAYFFEPENIGELVKSLSKCAENLDDVQFKGKKGFDVITNHFNREIINDDIVYFIENVFILKLENELLTN